MNKTNLLTDKLKVLHFAPEITFSKLFKSLPNLSYISADISSEIAMMTMDISDIPEHDNTYDVVLCFHVLEHVIDDRKAMSELFRILKPGGWAILQAPIDTDRDKTLEDDNIISPKERAQVFGRADHVRIYGRDYIDRLVNAGFIVKIDDYIDQLGEDTIRKYGLRKEERIYLCSKPLSKDTREAS